MVRNTGHFVLSLCSLLLLFTSCYKETETEETSSLGNWKKGSDFEGVARTEAVGFTIGEKAYVGTGFKENSTRLNDFWEFDAASKTWKQKADLPGAPRNSAVAFTIDNKAYVGTGYDGVNRLQDFWQYDPVTNAWQRIADFGGSGRYGAVAFALAGKGFVATGYDGNHLKDTWEYNPTTNTWVQKASLGGSKRTDALAFVTGDKAYVATGLNNGTYVDDIWEYDAANDVWNQKRRLINISEETYDDAYQIVRSNAVAFTLNGTAFITGGDYNGITASTWAYDAVNDVWTERTPFEAAARVGAVGFTLGGRGFITTGNNSAYRFDDLWEFQPDVEKVDND